MNDKTIVVTRDDNSLINHKGDNFEVVENGHLKIYGGENGFTLIICYAPGAWKSVRMLEN